MIGKQGMTRERLAPAGYVLVQGELWKAESTDADQTIESGKSVRVVRVDGLKLYVEAERTENREQKTDDRGQKPLEFGKRNAEGGKK